MKPANSNNSTHIITECPLCSSSMRLRPYGADMLTGEDGGCYYKLCEECKRAFIIRKGTNEIEYAGSLEGILQQMKIRKMRGKF